MHYNIVETPKGDSKTVGFGGFLVTFSAKKSLRPQAEACPRPPAAGGGGNAQG